MWKRDSKYFLNIFWANFTQRVNPLADSIVRRAWKKPHANNCWVLYSVSVVSPNKEHVFGSPSQETTRKVSFHVRTSCGSRISHWGSPTRWGGVDLWCGHFSVQMYVRMKELSPVGGAHQRRPPWICHWELSFFCRSWKIKCQFSCSMTCHFVWRFSYLNLSFLSV